MLSFSQGFCFVGKSLSINKALACILSFPSIKNKNDLQKDNLYLIKTIIL